MIVVPFMPFHMDGFEAQAAQPEIAIYAQSCDYGEFLFQAGEAYTALENGEVIACGGFVQISQRRALVWATLSGNAKARHMLFLTREVNRRFEQSSFERLETTVLHDFEAGHRWAMLLGMINETPGGMRGFGLNGETYDLYARVK